MRYRLTEDGPEHDIRIVPGAVIVDLIFDRPGQPIKLHRHTFDHVMTCKRGAARIVLDGMQRILKPGESTTVELGVSHSLFSLSSDTVVECRHEHADIHPDKMDGAGIPLEWLDRLTLREPAS